MRLYSPFLPSAALLFGCGQQATQQHASMTAAMPTPAPHASAPARASVFTLPGAICDRERDSETILRVQTVEAKLRSFVRHDPTFAGAWYEHAPCYRLVLAFTDGQPRQWVVDAAPPELKPYLAFGRSKYSAAEREAARMEIMAALAAAGLRFSFFVEGPPAERFTIGVRTPADAQVAMQAVPPRHRADVSIFVGNIEPQLER